LWKHRTGLSAIAGLLVAHPVDLVMLNEYQFISLGPKEIHVDEAKVKADHDYNYRRDAMLARVFARAMCLSVSVRLSACLSVTRRYCKTKKASVVISSPPGSPTILVFCRQISSQNSKGITPSGSVKQRRGG